MDIRIFLAHAVKLELDAEEAYLRLVDDMTAKGNKEAAGFFNEMAGFSRLHRETAMHRAGFDDSTDIHSMVDLWPGGISEIPEIINLDAPLSLDGAMQLAIEAETRGVAFYEGVSLITTDPQIRNLAEEFATEERGHLQTLERILTELTSDSSSIKYMDGRL